MAFDRDPQATALKVQLYCVEGVPMNSRWLSRPCPKCRAVLAVIVRPPEREPAAPGGQWPLYSLSLTNGVGGDPGAEGARPRPRGCGKRLKSL